jgi:MOSC domain-containing protein YiiM
MPTVVATCTGTVEEFEHKGRAGTTAIRKSAVADGVQITVEGVVGDQIANPNSHGGPLKTVYAYGADDLAFWERQLGRSLMPGSFGENLLVEGLDVSQAKPGERWRVGEALLEVTTIRTPCWKLAWAMGEDGFERRFQQAARPGAYLTVVEEGAVVPGDELRVVRSRMDHEITLRAIANAYHNDRRQRQAILDEVDVLPPAVAAAVVLLFG